MVFWHPKGWALWQQVEQYMRQASTATAATRKCAGRMVLPRSLWERTGHWENYRENMFTTESEKRDYALKPMNCPGHILIYNKGVRSYRDLPLRYGEFGSCHRNEPSGALHGLMRIRGFTQDDGHIFCTEEQILPECVAYTALVQKVYAHFGFNGHHLQGGDAAGEAHRDGRAVGPRRRARSRSRCEKIGRATTRSRRAKARSTARRSSTPEGRHRPRSGSAAPCRWTSSCPGAWAPSTSAADNTRKTPAMLHRAIVGSMERFIGILIEHFARRLPALAGAGAGRGPEHHRAPGRLRRTRRETPA